MSLPRAAKLLAAMPERERREFGASLRSAKRSGLYLLYGVLKSALQNNADFNKEDTFARLYDRPYTEREDYLIRNELRLLSSRIYDFIAEREYRKEYESNEGTRDVMLAKGLLDRRLYPEFEGMIDKSYQKALDRHDFSTATRLKDLHYRYLIFHNEISRNVMEQAREVAGEQLMNTKRVYRADVAVIQQNSVVCEETLRIMKHPVEQTAVAADADFAECDTPYTLFYENASRAYQSKGKERIAHSRAAVEYLRPVAEYFPNPMLLGLAVLASNCFAEQQYDEARACFEECMSFAASHGLVPRFDIIFNYGSTLMRFGEYRAVLDLFETYRSQLDAEPKVSFRCEGIRCFCHIFLRDPASALAAIPPNISQRPESEYQYFRFVYLILPYLNNDLESALRECRNFADYFTRHKGELSFPESRNVVGLYRRFYTVLLDATDREMMVKGLTPLKSDIESLLPDPSDPTDSLYMVWLRKEIERRLAD